MGFAVGQYILILFLSHALTPPVILHWLYELNMDI